MNARRRVVIVGGGIAGLTCALTLAGRLRSDRAQVVLLEANDTTGGRVRSEHVDGFTLDLGFQVYLSAYETAGRVLDTNALDLRPFAAGAVVHKGTDAAVIADPMREPRRALSGLVGGASGLVKLRDVAALTKLVVGGDSAFRPGRTAEQALRDAGVSDAMLDGFFRPFFGGVFFDRTLQTDAAMLGFTFGMFRKGRACIPSAGMGAIADQLTERCRASGVDVRTAARVTATTSQGVTLASGDTIDADAVVIATEAHTAADLLAGTPDANTERTDALRARPWRSTRSIWFASRTPVPHNGGGRGILHLDGAHGHAGPVNHLAVMTDVAPNYGSGDGRHLICANTVDTNGSDDDAVNAARAQLTSWFGDGPADWDLIRVHTIHHALPDQRTDEGGVPASKNTCELAPGLVLAGDHLTNTSIDGACASGLAAADTVCAHLAATPAATV